MGTNESAANATSQVPAVYGSNVFNDAVMRARLPKNVYRQLRATIEHGRVLDPAIGDIVANAMKDWAIEKGATHFCHWFQPLTGATAEKHDSFISPTPDGRIIMEFSGKELVRGEPDASSFPSGGLRATFEARGYTAWDCTSPVFVKKDGDNISLFIPSAFCSYTGAALDQKTPLLRSLDALNHQALRVLRALGDKETSRVFSTLGGEQEYFLLDKRFVESRLDLCLTGRTLFGAPSPKGQEMDDHYFGSLNERVASFMYEANTELWKLGVAAKTQHNEVAPGQYELAPFFTTVNVATDNDQLIMDTLQKVALRHDLVCLLHEKPFAGVNGSGKHNNWSPNTNTGASLLDPGKTPHDNMQFLLFLFAVIRAVDKYAVLLRASVAGAGNDHRLGANEAPPAIVSIFLGDQLNDLYEQLRDGAPQSSLQKESLKLGVSSLPELPKDTTDRNRTSPFAFTGKKFEFRMPGASQSLSPANFTLNTIVADVLAEIADELEKVDTAEQRNQRIQELLQGYAREHSRIIFNGDNYAPAWVEEAARRGLPNIGNTVDSLLRLTDPENVAVFERHRVLTAEELTARQEVLLENYVMTINIEGSVMLQMVRRQILPATVTYAGQLADAVNAISTAGMTGTAERALLKRILDLNAQLYDAIEALEKTLKAVGEEDEVREAALSCRDRVLPAMNTLRAVADELEALTDDELWPLPTYGEMLFHR